MTAARPDPPEFRWAAAGGEIECFPPGAICRTTEMTSWKTWAVNPANIVILWTLLSAFQPFTPSSREPIATTTRLTSMNARRKRPEEARGRTGLKSSFIAASIRFNRPS